MQEIENIKARLFSYFDKAKAIDYQAIFKPYFTDAIDYTDVVNETLYELIKVLAAFDFSILPTDVIGNILENIVPKDERQKFGQYFTQETLANLVAFPAVKTNNDILFDPTCGAGTFLNAFYQIMCYHGNTNHTYLLSHIWGNDVSHFPAILSVINLYKQDVTQIDNFPRVMRDDFFNLNVGDKIPFPDSTNYANKVEVTIPKFDGIASNLPFIQQEDIPKEDLKKLLSDKFKLTQWAFLKNNVFNIDGHSDYFVYCVYYSIQFLKDDGVLSVITSNAWLGKEYGFQFKKFLLDNFHIKYIVKSNAEHWFSDSQVSTIYVVLQKGTSNEPTKFITVNFKLKEYFSQTDIKEQIQKIENFYCEIDNCDNPRNKEWKVDSTFDDLYLNDEDHLSLCIVERQTLIESIEKKDNWSKYFISAKLFENFDKLLIKFYPNIINVFRGERTGWNEMFVIPEKDVAGSGIDKQYLIPYIKSSSELNQIEFDDNYKFRLFVCKDNINNVSQGTRSWINKFENAQNKNGTGTIKEVCAAHKPFWYSLNPKEASIITSINPYERFFFTYSNKPFAIDQRLIAMNVRWGYDVELIAALLNSAITFLTVEIRGTSRSLGALDLNADYMKQLCILNPNLLYDEQKEKIINAFRPLKQRNVEPIYEEVKKRDRIHFDKTVLGCFGISENLLSAIYSLLVASVMDRVKMKDK